MQLELPNLKLPADVRLIPAGFARRLLGWDRRRMWSELESGRFVAWRLASEEARANCPRLWRESVLHELGLLPVMPPGDQAEETVIPNRPVRSTELQRWLDIGERHVQSLGIRIVRAPVVSSGPNSFTLYDGADARRFLKSRRM
jgi:hypothetical protein